MSVQPDPVWPDLRPGGDHTPAVAVRTGFEPPDSGPAGQQATPLTPVTPSPLTDLNAPYPVDGFPGMPPYPPTGPFPSRQPVPGTAMLPPGSPAGTYQGGSTMPPGQPWPPGFPPPAGMYPPAGPPLGFGPQPVSPSDERLWATLAHAGALLMGFVAPLVIYLAYKDRSPFIRRHAAQALNFHIMLLLGFLVMWVLMFVLVGALLLPLWVLAALIMPIVAAVAANRGEGFSYPLTPQMVT